MLANTFRDVYTQFNAAYQAYSNRSAYSLDQFKSANAPFRHSANTASRRTPLTSMIALFLLQQAWAVHCWILSGISTLSCAAIQTTFSALGARALLLINDQIMS